MLLVLGRLDNLLDVQRVRRREDDRVEPRVIQELVVAVVKLELLLLRERFEVVRVRPRGARDEVDLVALPAIHRLDERPPPPTESHDSSVDHLSFLTIREPARLIRCRPRAPGRARSRTSRAPSRRARPRRSA